MGSQSPYENEEDSSLDESDDEQIADIMTDDMFEQQVTDLMHQIVSGKLEMTAALINIQQIKHGFSKSNDAC